MNMDRKPRARMTMGAFTKVTPPTQVPGGWKLKPASGRVAGAVVLGIMATFWNGIVWTGLIGFMKSKNSFDLILVIVLSLFALIGLLLAVFFAYTLLKALYTPKPTIELSSETIDPQRPTQVRWSFAGTKPLLDLRISLVLREECQYRRGTDTMTDRHEVREIILFERPEPARDGSLSLIIPPDLPPSFSTTSNQLVWCLRLRGSVPRLPDVDDEFPLTVRPTQLCAATIQATDLPEGIILPDGTPPLALAGNAITGAAVAGVLNVPGKSVLLRLSWATSGKGDSQTEVACVTTAASGISGFVLTLPTLPPAWSGTVLSVTWHLEALVDDVVVANVPLSAPPLPTLPSTDAAS